MVYGEEMMFKVYKTEGIDEGGGRKELVSKFWEVLRDEIEKDEDTKEIKEISTRLGTPTHEYMLSSIRNSIDIKFVPIRDGRLAQMFVKLSKRAIQNGFSNSIDGLVMARARRSQKDGGLTLIRELIEMNSDIEFRAVLNSNDGTITRIESLRGSLSGPVLKLESMVLNVLRALGGKCGASGVTLQDYEEFITSTTYNLPF
jgi:hypothetical protein